MAVAVRGAGHKNPRSNDPVRPWRQRPKATTRDVARHGRPSDAVHGRSQRKDLEAPSNWCIQHPVDWRKRDHLSPMRLQPNAATKELAFPISSQEAQRNETNQPWPLPGAVYGHANLQADSLLLTPTWWVVSTHFKKYTGSIEHIYWI